MSTANADNSKSLFWLAEVNRLIEACPPAEIIQDNTDENIEWFGDVSHLFGNVANPSQVGKLEALIPKIASNKLVSDGSDPRREILIMMRSIKRSLQLELDVTLSTESVRPPAQLTEEVKEDLKQLANLVSGSNQIDEEQREILLSEIAIFESSICQPRLSADLIHRFVQGILLGVTMKLVGETADQVAGKIASALLGFLAASATSS